MAGMNHRIIPLEEGWNDEIKAKASLRRAMIFGRGGERRHGPRLSKRAEPWLLYPSSLLSFLSLAEHSCSFLF
jgi:hypothetical protein